MKSSISDSESKVSLSSMCSSIFYIALKKLLNKIIVFHSLMIWISLNLFTK